MSRPAAGSTGGGSTRLVIGAALAACLVLLVTIARVRATPETLTSVGPAETKRAQNTFERARSRWAPLLDRHPASPPGHSGHHHVVRVVLAPSSGVWEPTTAVIPEFSPCMFWPTADEVPFHSPRAVSRLERVLAAECAGDTAPSKARSDLMQIEISGTGEWDTLIRLEVLRRQIDESGVDATNAREILDAATDVRLRSKDPNLREFASLYELHALSDPTYNTFNAALAIALALEILTSDVSDPLVRAQALDTLISVPGATDHLTVDDIVALADIDEGPAPVHTHYGVSSIALAAAIALDESDAAGLWLTRMEAATSEICAERLRSCERMLADAHEAAGLLVGKGWLTPRDWREILIGHVWSCYRSTPSHEGTHTLEGTSHAANRRLDWQTWSGVSSLAECIEARTSDGDVDAPAGSRVNLIVEFVP